MNKKIARNFFYCFLILNIIGIWYFSYTDHPYFNIESIKEYLAGQNLYIALGVYMLLMMLRGLTILPGTPLLVLGAILFPTFHAIIAIAIAVQLYVIIIDRYSHYLDFPIPNKLGDYEKKLGKNTIFYIILLCVIPGMSMNILAYFLSVLKVPLAKKMIGIGIGSLVNLFIYLHVFEALFNFST